MTGGKRWEVNGDGVEYRLVFGLNHGVLALLYGVFQRLIATRPRMQVSDTFLVIVCVVSRGEDLLYPKVCGLQVSRDIIVFDNSGPSHQE